MERKSLIKKMKKVTLCYNDYKKRAQLVVMFSSMNKAKEFIEENNIEDYKTF